MTRSLVTTAAFLMLCLGAFVLTQYDRFGWAQVTPPEGDAAPPAADDPFAAPSDLNPFAAAEPSEAQSDDPFAAPEPAEAPKDDPFSAAPPRRKRTRPPEEPSNAAPSARQPAGGSAIGAPEGPAGGMMGMEMGMPHTMGGYGAYEEYGSDYEEMGYDMMSRPAPLHVRINQKAAEMKQAKTKEARERAEQALEKLLSDYFDNDMRRRQAELDQVKARVARLEALFKKRQVAKEEIIDLQLKTMVNESEGLGFFSARPSGASGYGSAGYGEYGMDKMEMDEGMYGEMGYGAGYGTGMYGGEVTPPTEGPSQRYR